MSNPAQIQYCRYASGSQMVPHVYERRNFWAKKSHFARMCGLSGVTTLAVMTYGGRKLLKVLYMCKTISTLTLKV